MPEDLSIHPRVVKGRTVYDKVNTCAPRKRMGGKLAKKQARLERRRLDHANTIRNPSLANAYTTPGSMNSHKR